MYSKYATNVNDKYDEYKCASGIERFEKG